MNCHHCGAPMTGRKRKYCGSLCRNRAAALTRGPRLGTCTEDGCDGEHRARGLCAMHYRRWERANGMARPPADAWGPRRQANWKKRYAAKRTTSSDAERIEPTEVYERDGWTCQLCFKAVDPTLTFPHPLSPSLDHRLALARGGPHTLSNVQLAHFRCNSAKGVGRPATALDQSS